jgi:hypothetical protein
MSHLAVMFSLVLGTLLSTDGLQQTIVKSCLPLHFLVDKTQKPRPIYKYRATNKLVTYITTTPKLVNGDNRIWLRKYMSLANCSGQS